MDFCLRVTATNSATVIALPEYHPRGVLFWLIFFFCLKLKRKIFENEALENEERSTKHPNLENEYPKSRKRSIHKLKNEDPQIENEAPKTRKRGKAWRKSNTREPHTRFSASFRTFCVTAHA